LVVPILTLLPASEGDAVVDEQRVVLAPRIADAVAGVERARARQRQREPRRHVAEAVPAAEPVGDETHLLQQRLLVADDGPALVAVAAGATDEAVAAAGHARPV